MRRFLKKLLLVLAGALVLLVGLGAWEVRRHLPHLKDGKLPGLSAPVSVVLDERGVPTIRAGEFLDAVRVQGYLAASERLFQMELMRRTADGALAELFGAAALPLDRRHRTYGFRQVAEAAAALLPAGERRASEAYAEGVNAYIVGNPGRWGIEFRLLGAVPRPWTTADSLKVLLLMHEDLSSSWREELQGALVQGLPESRRALLMPRSTDGEVLLVPDAPGAPPPPAASLGAAGEARAALEALSNPAFPAGPRSEAGSNNWVLAGARSASGKPLLANDPHLGLQAPGIWIPLRIEWKGRFVQGVAIPGGPGVVLGLNDRIAWGFTNLMTDVQDLFWEPPTGERLERISVKGGSEEVLRVPLGRHGPQLRPGLSLAWTALDPALLRNPFVDVDQARNWKEFNEALDGFPGPAQNAVYADRDGHIGWRATGVVPLRRPGDDGSLPRDGADPANDWRGFVPMADMPRLLDPPQGFLATANQRVIGTSFPNPVATEWAHPARARRIAERLAGASGWTAADMARLQLDTRSPLYSAFRDAALPLLPEALRAEWKDWDGEARKDSKAFTRLITFQREWRRAVLERLLPPGLDADAWAWADQDSVPLALLRADQAAWSRLGLGDKRAAVDQALRRARGQENWNLSWGRANRLEIRHPLGRAGGILSWLFDPPAAEQDGAGRCVRVSGKAFGQSLRLVVDWGHPEAATLVLPLGVSGHLGSPHRHDQRRDWLQGDPEGIRTRIQQGPVGRTLQLVPAG